jgi:hypothetical protein
VVMKPSGSKKLVVTDNGVTTSVNWRTPNFVLSIASAPARRMCRCRWPSACRSIHRSSRD